jgi:hypothetical protein
MSDKNLSLGSGGEAEPAKNQAIEGGKDMFPESEKDKSSPWDSLRPVEPKADEPKPPSRLGIFFRKALRWVTGLIVVFGFGVGTTWFVRVQPMSDQLEDLNNQLQAAVLTANELESQYSSKQNEKQDLETQLSDAQLQIESLEEELLNAELNVDVMKIWVDVSSAELALANDDMVTAKASLAGTDGRLGELKNKLQGEDQETIEGMRSRLALVLDELETNRFAAMRDLEVLASNLMALERSLFGN